MNNHLFFERKSFRNAFLNVSSRILSAAVIILCIAGCKSEKTEPVLPDSVSSETVSNIIEETEKTYTEDELSAYTKDSFIDPADFFTLDYTPYIPEDQAEAIRISRSEAGSNAPVTDVSTNYPSSSVPGLRNLDEYMTAYSSKSAEPAHVVIPENIRKDENRSFTVADWGPQGSLSSGVRNPSFYVLFSEPVVPLSALGEPSDKSPYMSITPSIKGKFRWYGTSLLSFEAEENCNPLETYTIHVSSSSRSLYGSKITGQLTFSTTADPLEIVWNKPGYRWTQETWNYVDPDDVQPEAAHDIRVQFNFPVKADEIAAKTRITAAGKEVRFTVEQELADTVAYLIEEDLPFNTDVEITVDETATCSFHTLRNFTFESVFSESSTSSYSNPVWIRFSHQPDRESAISSITTDPAMPVTEDNIEIMGNYIILHDLPVTFNSSYGIFISKSLTDIYGRELGMQLRRQIKVPDAASEINYQNYGVTMLEATYPHRLMFDYQNVEPGSFYVLQKADNPLSTDSETAITAIKSKLQYNLPLTDNVHLLNTDVRNQRIMEGVELDDYLTNGYGSVMFAASARFLDKNGDPYERNNTTVVQVTNLGLTVRYAINKAVVLVTHLDDGSPVEGAVVYAHSSKEGKLSHLSEGTVPILAQATTGADGLAVLNLPLEAASTFFSDYSTSPYFAITAVSGDDSASFQPSSHATWRSGVYSYWSTANALTSRQRTFLFSDRGLYKPGETVSFRGIDRTQQMGSFLPYTGNATITLSDSSWRNPAEYGKIEVTTSSSGGFFGSFTLPETLEPGSYRIRYTREDSTTTIDQYITVAYFERLKYQTEIAMPSSPVITGDSIQATLSASYLAGGVLAGASYDASWMTDPWYFSPDDPSLKGYIFGPYDTSEGRRYLEDTQGSLNAEGESVLSCATTGNSIKGTPYRYRLQANVTDASNQLISVTGATVVHPASYYIGISKQADGSAFARAGSPLTFDYKLVTPDETVVAEEKDAAALATSLSGSNNAISIKLTREEWSLVQQQGVGGTVYSRYEKNLVDEETKSVSLSASGTFVITPEKSGYHILSVTAKDASDREIITEYRFFVTGSGYTSLYHDDANLIKLTPDQSQYNPGDTAHILLESPLPAGTYLITTEREGIFTEEVRTFDQNVTVLDIPVARNYIPVFYVSVSSYSVREKEADNQYGVADLDKPKGCYGVAEVFVNPRVKAFSLDIETSSQSYLPGEEVTLTVKATKGGQPLSNAELTVMAVDRGVLDLIGYHVPDPIDFFYDPYQFHFCVKGGDSRELLMDPVTYMAKNLMGGDSDDGDKAENREDFNPTALFEPCIVTDEDGYATVTFKLPDTLTTYRITAFGVEGELLALQESEIIVQNPVNVQQVMPRRLRERDTSEAGVILTNLDGVTHAITVEASIENAASGKVTAGTGPGSAGSGGRAYIDGKTSCTVSVQPGQTSPVYFDIAAVESGSVKVKFSIKSDVLNENVICPLTIERPYIMETNTTTGALQENTITENVVIPSFSDNGRGSVDVTLDATRLTLVKDSIHYVFNYPYGCLEQQSSKLLPMLLFSDYIDTFEFEADLEGKTVRETVLDTFNSWFTLQHDDGGFGYWPTSSLSNTYVSTRIAHCAVLALSQGFTENQICIDLNLLKSYLKSEQRKNYLNPYEKAYITYILALSGEKYTKEQLTAQMNEEHAGICVWAFTGLTDILQNGASSSIADQCRKKINSCMRPTTRGVDLSDPVQNSVLLPIYNTRVEQLALTLELYTRLNPSDEWCTRLLNQLMSLKSADNFGSTASTAHVFEAIAAVIETSGAGSTDFSASVSLGAMQLASGSFHGLAASSISESVLFGDPRLQGIQSDSLIPMTFAKNGEGTLYYTASLSYAVPEENQTAREEGISVFITLYDDTTGEEIKSSKGSSLIALQTGKVYKARIKLSSTRDRTYLALRAPVPSGAEILDATFNTTPDTINATGMGGLSKDWDEYSGWMNGGMHYMSNQKIYDNEIQFFWDDFNKGETTIEFKFRATRRGVFPTPPVQAECMYEAEVFGRTAGTLYTIE